MPARGGWRMPAEWAPHERTWMAWPSAGYTLGDTEEEADEARAPGPRWRARWPTSSR